MSLLFISVAITTIVFLARIPVMGFGSNISFDRPEEVAAVALLMAKVAGGQQATTTGGSQLHLALRFSKARLAFFRSKSQFDG